MDPRALPFGVRSAQMLWVDAQGNSVDDPAHAASGELTETLDNGSSRRTWFETGPAADQPS
jgi:hypothetical protein